MKALVRELLRQRARTLLTVLGVALGILTLVLLGALGEHFRALVDESAAYTRGLLRLYTKTNARGVNPGIGPEALDRVRGDPGVERVCPTLVLYLDGFDLETDPLSFVTPKPLVEGLPPESARVLRAAVPLREGRWLQAGDERQALVASWLAARRGLRVGQPVTIRHQRYELVGIYDAPDAPMIPAGIVPYGPLHRDAIEPETERALAFFSRLEERLPPLLRGALSRRDPQAREALARAFVEEQASLFRVYEIVPRDRTPEGTRALARSLRERVPDLAVIDPDRIEESARRALGLSLLVMLVVTVVATVVGGLLIVNTMAMAVLERRRELAVRAAIGATPAQIAGEVVLEAALLGLCGAGLGIGLGVLTVLLLEPPLLGLLETGARLFLLTPRLLGLAALYGVGMGALAGGLPAWRAARTDPARVLREL